MKAMLTILIFTFVGSIIADGADDDYETYSNAYYSTIEKERDTLKNATDEHQRKVVAATRKYLDQLEELLAIYTKDQKRNEARKVRNEIAQIRDVLKSLQQSEAKGVENPNSAGDELAILEFSNRVTLNRLRTGARTFENRKFTWKELPDVPFSKYTATGLNYGGFYSVTVQTDGYVYIAGVADEVDRRWTADGWEETEITLPFTDGMLTVYRKAFQRMEKVEIKKLGSATIVLVK